MPLEKATITNTDTGELIPVMFNPEEYTLNKDINYAQTAVPGLSSPILQFVNGGLRTLEMELFLDTVEQNKQGGRVVNSAGDDVRKLANKVIDLMSINPATHAPPVLLFVWGSLTFTCVLARASQKYTRFLADGTPVRARLQVNFSEFRNTDLEAKEVKRETADYSKIHVVGDDETISAIAWRDLANPKLWRAVALRNGIQDPRQLQTGQRLIIPQLPYRDPNTAKVYK